MLVNPHPTLESRMAGVRTRPVTGVRPAMAAGHMNLATGVRIRPATATSRISQATAIPLATATDRTIHIQATTVVRPVTIPTATAATKSIRRRGTFSLKLMNSASLLKVNIESSLRTKTVN